jgi:adenine deaminase
VDDIQQNGHLDDILRSAVSLGLEPLTAIQMVTRNPAEYFGFRDRGSLTPGMRADLVLLENLETMQVGEVYKDGSLVVENGTLQHAPPPPSSAPEQWQRLNMASVTADTFRIPHPGGRARIMEIIPGQITTRMCLETVPARGGYVRADTNRDIVTLFVLDRHQASGRVGRGLVRGLGLQRGAIASTVAHDSHNVIAAGVSREDIYLAVATLREMGGGFSVAAGGRIRAKLPLEVAGLMSTRGADAVARDFRQVTRAVHDLGCRVPAPFMTLSFLALPVIPEVKLTDRGLVDVHRFQIVPLFHGQKVEEP